MQNEKRKRKHTIHRLSPCSFRSNYDPTLYIWNLEKFREQISRSSINFYPGSQLKGLVFDKPLQQNLKLLKLLRAVIVTSGIFRLARDFLAQLRELAVKGLPSQANVSYVRGFQILIRVVIGLLQVFGFVFSFLHLFHGKATERG